MAVGVAFIGYLTWRTNNNKLKLELFERRYQIYKATQSYISGYVIENQVSDEIKRSFFIAMQDATFLFPNEISEYLKSVWKNGEEHRFRDRRIDRLDGAAQDAEFDLREAAFKTLAKELETLGTKFARHIRISA